MVGVLLIGAAGATALLVAATLRLPSLVSTLLTAYLAFVANLGLVTLALSPFHAVTLGGLAAAEGVLLVAALGLWWSRRRPGLPVEAARGALGEVARSPLTLLFLAVAAGALAYELVLALTVPPNNWDSLTYHLARAAAWAQEGGVHWIPNAPTDRMNEFQPLAEQEILFLFVATGSSALFALPQYLAELAILVAVYGSARRLGFGAPAAACSASLFATFTLVAVEATTAQNDLVAASFPAAAACLILGGTRRELLLAGGAVGMGLGAKLTTALVLPVLAWLVALRGRRAAAVALAGAALGLAAVGIWGYVLNAAETGNLLGHGGGRVEHTAWPSYPGSVRTGMFVLYELLDLSLLSDRLIFVLAIGGAFAALGAGAVAYRRAGLRLAGVVGAGVALPFVAPLLVIGGGHVLAFVTRELGFPARGPGGDVGSLNRSANEDYSAFGPIGAVTLLAVPLVAAIAYARRRADARHLALALALPSFLVLLSLYAVFNYFLTRFMLVPAVLAAPLLALYFRHRAVTAAFLVVATVTVALTLAEIPTKPLESRPWQLSQAEAVRVAGEPEVAEALAAYERLVPPRACVGAVIGPNEPSFLLWGRDLDRRIHYLALDEVVLASLRKGLFYVVVSSGASPTVARAFGSAAWKLHRLGAGWQLAVAPGAASGDCSALGN